MAERPQVKPNAILGAIIFALVAVFFVYFYPQIELLLPFNGKVLTIESAIQPVSIEKQCKAATTIVVAKIGEKSKNHVLNKQDTPFVYSEVTIEVQQVLKGHPQVGSDNTMLTYELGGSILREDMGAPKKYTFAYTDSAKLDKGAVLMLFLDEENNILNEKYGVLLQSAEVYYYDYENNVYKLDQIKAYIGG